MMRIDHLSTSADRAGRYRVQFSDGSVMRLYRQTVQDFSLCTGSELSDGEIEKLKIAAGEMSAKMRAVRIVSASSVSKRELQYRLQQKGEDPEQAKAAVAWMSDLDLLDDEKTAQQIVNRCIAKGYGVNRAKQVLYEKKIPKSLWDVALEDYPDMTEKIMDFLRCRLGNDWDDKDLKRAIDACQRRGHNYSAIRKALMMLQADLDEFPEE